MKSSFYNYFNTFTLVEYFIRHLEEFSHKICDWYRDNKRDLPWRNTSDPYKIWLSEIILQQTRVDQGMSYYLKFIDEFPTVQQLAKAKEEKVLKLWQGLGYYSRARNLHATARIITDDYNSKFPLKHKEILNLKGIGDYTAAAISSFAFNQPYAVVDGNVYRVLSRVFNIATPIDSTEGKKSFYTLANELLNKNNPGEHNQAIMELGALVCKPLNPNCELCPLQPNCLALEKQTIEKLPVKSKAIKVRNRYFNYLIIKHNNNILINKRSNKDIWTNLYDFPNIETNKELTENKLITSIEWQNLFTNKQYSIISCSETFKHILSHQRIFAKFWEIECNPNHLKQLPKSTTIIEQDSITKYPVPRLVDIYLKKANYLP